MGWGKRVRATLQALAAPVLMVGLTGYFGWSATQGPRGLQVNALRQAQLAGAQAELRRVEGERDALERRVAGLRPQRLDLDTLDERTRTNTGWTNPGELVVLFTGTHRLF